MARSDDDEIATLHGQGLGQRRIAIAIGRSERVVRDSLVRLGLRAPTGDAPPPPGSATLRERVRELVGQGLTDSQVATALQVAYERVRTVRRSLGLPPVVEPGRGPEPEGRRVHVVATCLSAAELEQVKVVAGDTPLSVWIRDLVLVAARGK